MSEVHPGTRIRPRAASDLPALGEALAGQQPVSRYPLRWPLPFPVEEFLVREAQERAWVAEQDDRVVGHVAVARVGPELAVRFLEATGAAHADALASISVLFVSLDVRGSGVGGLLLDRAVSWVREQGRVPVLDVLPTNVRTLAVYAHLGWREVGRARPAWLPDDAPDALLMVLDP